jgi:hypothetical protein
MKEELSVKDLMINDWVMTAIDNFKNHPMNVVGIEREFVSIADDNIEMRLRPHQMEPIPLTSELLEKKGFKRVPQPGCANPYHWMLEKYEEESEGLLYRIKAFNNPFRGMFVSIDNPSACETISFGKQIEHVHELQHALRLCEIKMEIKLED